MTSCRTCIYFFVVSCFNDYTLPVPLALTFGVQTKFYQSPYPPVKKRKDNNDYQ